MHNELSKNNQYNPAEDTFFVADHLKQESGNSALDIGTGSGYLVQILDQNFPFVVATDINFNTLQISKNKLRNCICCEGAAPLRCQFDLVVCNMPYLPSEKILDRTTDGGEEGVEIPLKIIISAKKCLKKTGRLVFLTSLLANYQRLISETEKLGFSVKILSRKKLFFEELLLAEAKFQES